LFSASECKSWGNFGMFVANEQSMIEAYDSQYFSAKMITQQWVDPMDAGHSGTQRTPISPRLVGPALVTADALLGP
jgi:hypothetical protein